MAIENQLFTSKIHWLSGRGPEIDDAATREASRAEFELRVRMVLRR